MSGLVNPGKIFPIHGIDSRSVWKTYKHVSESLEALEKYSERYFSLHSHHLEFSRKSILKPKMSNSKYSRIPSKNPTKLIIFSKKIVFKTVEYLCMSLDDLWYIRESFVKHYAF